MAEWSLSRTEMIVLAGTGNRPWSPAMAASSA